MPLLKLKRDLSHLHMFTWILQTQVEGLKYAGGHVMTEDSFPRKNEPFHRDEN